jgi:parvulin-like peptidyl-prolyl isomerase
MKRSPWRTTFVHALAVSAIALAACGSVQAQAILAARVNGSPIPLDLLDRQFEELLDQRRLRIAQMQSPDKAKALKREALDNLIRVELLWQEARSSGLAVSDDEVQRAVDEARSRFRNADAFLRRIERSGFTEASYREHTRKLLSGERYAQRIVDRDVRVTDKDIDEFYEINPRLFKRAAKVKVRQILVAVPANASAEQKAQARQKIEALRARVRAGESFEELARQHSDDATRQWGGELDPFEHGEKAKPFEDAAFALAAPGATSDVVETAAGLHLIRLEGRTPETSVPLDVARPRIREYLIGSRGKEAVDKEVEQLRALAKVEMLTPL